MPAAKSTVYRVVLAERFAHVTEGLFSIAAKAEAFRQQLVAQAVAEQQRGEREADIDFDELYEVDEWVLDELADAFTQHSVIVHLGEPGDDVEVVDHGEELVAELRETEHVSFPTGEHAIIAHGRSRAEAVLKAYEAVQTVRRGDGGREQNQRIA